MFLGPLSTAAWLNLTREEYVKLKDSLQRYLEDACKSGGYDLMVTMLTNANGSGSYLLSAGDKKHIVPDMFKKDKEDFINGLVSRKKQLLPAVIKSLSTK